MQIELWKDDPNKTWKQGTWIGGHNIGDWEEDKDRRGAGVQVNEASAIQREPPKPHFSLQHCTLEALELRLCGCC